MTGPFKLLPPLIMGLVVQKYGGSSLATPKHIRIAAERIKELRLSGADVVVVASAMGHTTDHLLKLASKTVKIPPSRELDMLLTAGERVSMSLLAMSLQERGVPAISFTGSQSGIITSSDHAQAQILEIRPQRIQEELKKGKVVIIAGFQGVSLDKEITTLGRGGSDTTAVALAAVLKADRCEVLTDVEGIFSADPRIVPRAKLFEKLSYDECLELSSLGAKMHSRSIELAKKFEVKVWIGSSHNRKSVGTQVGKNESQGEKMEKTNVKGITTKDGYHYFSATVQLKDLAPLLAKSAIDLKFFSHSNQHTAFLCESSLALKTKELLEQMKVQYEEVEKVSLISAVGEGISNSREILPQFLEVLEESGSNHLLVTTNSLSLVAAIPTPHKERVAQALHHRFIEKNQ